ncbi:MAG: site-specific integrase [Phycisphaerales bacterium]
MPELVRLRTRPSRDGKIYKYFLDYLDENRKRRQISLGHADRRKAQKQKDQKERELRMGIVAPGSMRLSRFLEKNIELTRGQVRENTILEYQSTMKDFIKIVGDIDCQTVEHRHGERFMQACLDAGNRHATANKKIGTMKRLFQLAVERGQMDINPFRFIHKLKAPKRNIRVFTDEECQQMLKVARESKIGFPFRWDIVILIALSTGMRRGEILNATWNDIDFAGNKINISSKQDTAYTWEWQIKDSESRKVPLTDEVIRLLTEHQAEQPDGYPYVFVPPARYDFIQQQRKEGKWTTRKRLCPMNNFQRQFRIILSKAAIKTGEFHDFRRTCLTNWLTNGLSEFDVMTMAGHSSFDTTRRFYLAVRNDLLDKARIASSKALASISVAHLLRA